MPIYALWKVEDAFFIRPADGAAQAADIADAVKAAESNNVAVFDLKKLLRYHPEFSAVPLKNFFDVKLANNLCNGGADSDSAVELVKKWICPMLPMRAKHC